MTDIARRVVEEWYSEWQERWGTQSVQPRLLVCAEDPFKAVATLDGGPVVASITVWGAGTIEVILFAVKTKTEDIQDQEFRISAELRHLLDAAAERYGDWLNVNREQCLPRPEGLCRS